MCFMWLMPWKTIAVDCIDSFHFTYLKLEAYEVCMQIYAKWDANSHFEPWALALPFPQEELHHWICMCCIWCCSFQTAASAGSQTNPKDLHWAPQFKAIYKQKLISKVIGFSRSTPLSKIWTSKYGSHVSWTLLCSRLEWDMLTEQKKYLLKFIVLIASNDHLAGWI